MSSGLEMNLYTADSIIIATGANAKWIGLESELRLRGHGVSACATCDAFFFKGKNVFVVGGGDTAMEEAIFLSKFAKSVTVIHRRESLRASKIMQERAMANPKISFIWNSVVTNVIGEDHVTAMEIENRGRWIETGCSCGGALHRDRAHSFYNFVYRTDSKQMASGYVVVKNRTLTSIEGVFAAGTSRIPDIVRQ